MKFPQTTLSSMLEAATVSARLAGQHAMEQIKYVKPSVKNGNEMVTEADRQCQNIIIEQIRNSFPDDGFIAEEGADGKIFKLTPRTAPKVWWVIDPIDGTNNYARGILSFSVSVAAVCDGWPVVAAVFDPATDSMFTTSTGSDTQLNSSKISVSNDELNKLTSFAVDNKIPEEFEMPARKIMNACRFRNLGTTAMHLAYIAKGSLVGAITSSPALWDIAAGYLLIKNAGGIVTDFKGNEIFPVDTESYEGQRFEILATNKKSREQVAGFLDL
jgi:myo-inositol-1(or 4)-monophosphatase